MHLQGKDGQVAHANTIKKNDISMIFLQVLLCILYNYHPNYIQWLARAAFLSHSKNKKKTINDDDTTSYLGQRYNMKDNYFSCCV